MPERVSDLSKYSAEAERLARQAGAVIMGVYAEAFTVARKPDDSPVTVADRKAEAAIVSGLEKLRSGIPIVAEEAVSAGHTPPHSDEFWLVDPLDGTKEFVNRNGEFTVNIALIVCGEPVLGVIFAPALNRLYVGVQGQGAIVHDARGRRSISCSMQQSSRLRVLASRTHGDQESVRTYVESQGCHIAELSTMGSSLKFCVLASGDADIYPRLGRTMEWDIAAGHAILSAAGGRVLDLTGTPLRYGKRNFENPHFVAWAGPL